MFQKRKITLIDPSFHGRARSYLLQSVLAAIALGVILLLETGVSSAGITASIASSVFLVFVVPHSVASTTRRVVGGHVVAVIIGVSAFGILNLIVDNPAEISGQTFALAGAISVGVAILMMALTNTEHPPPPRSRNRAQPRCLWRQLSRRILHRQLSGHSCGRQTRATSLDDKPVVARFQINQKRCGLLRTVPL